MGIMPLQFLPEHNADSLGLSGKEKFTIAMPGSLSPRQQLTVKVGNRQQQPENELPSGCSSLSAILTSVFVPADQWREVLRRHRHVRQRDRRYHLPTRRTPQICRSDFPLKMTPLPQSTLPCYGADTWTAAPPFPILTTSSSSPFWMELGRSHLETPVVLVDVRARKTPFSSSSRTGDKKWILSTSVVFN